MEDSRNNFYTENNVNPKLNEKEKWSRDVDEQENSCYNESDHQLFTYSEKNLFRRNWNLS